MQTFRGWLANLSIVTKLASTITLTLLTAVAVQGTLISDNFSALLNEQTVLHGRAFTRQVAAQLNEPILARDEFTTEYIINTLLKDHDILGVTLLTHNGLPPLSRGITPPASQIAQQMRNIEIPYQWQGERGNRYLTFYSPAISNNVEVGRLYITYSTQLLTQAQQARLVVILTSSLLVLLIGLIFTYRLSHLITQPIYRLIRASRAIAEGDYHTHFDTRRGDELGTLSNALNSMTEALIHKGFVEQTLSRYVSDKVARQILTDSEAQDLGGKNIEASVLFADIAGFTSLSEKMDAAEVNQMLNDYFWLIDIAAQLAHGHVDKYMGDCAMLLFGVPEEDVEHRFHAVYAALLIQKLLLQFNEMRRQQHKPLAHFCIGINAGSMLAGNMGSPSRMQYTVIGDAVNLAFRLSGAAASDEILVASPMLGDSSLAQRLRYEEAGSIRVKGKAQPISTCRITGVSDTLQQQLEHDTVSILAKTRQ